MIWLNRAQSGSVPPALFHCSSTPGIARLRLTLCLALLASIPGLAGAQNRSLLTRHVREVTTNGQARLLGRLPATQSMRVDIVLPLQNQAELGTVLQGLYDPKSPSYRQFLTVQDFTERFGPSQEDYDSLTGFANANGLTVVGGSRDRMQVQVKGSVATIENAFHVTMGVYQHPTENRTFYAPDREPTVNLPVSLWHISGLDNYSTPHSLLKQRSMAVNSMARGAAMPVWAPVPPLPSWAAT